MIVHIAFKAELDPSLFKGKFWFKMNFNFEMYSSTFVYFYYDVIKYEYYIYNN